tara:strand:+ start:224 stop:385 length:162 start_codon:yes stop_codon:yes gene_type:complete
MSSKTQRLIALLERNLKKDHLYDDEQVKLMKNQLRILKEQLINLKKSSKGFGQ